MVGKLVRSGLIGGLVLSSGWSVMAQEAQPAPQAASGCSGFSCLFSKTESRPAPAPAPVPVAQPAVDADDAATPPASAKPSRPRPVVKPVAPVTIAASGAEAARLRTLAGTLRKSRVQIVEPKGGHSADFTVTASVEPGGPGEKARLFTEQLHIVAGAGVTAAADLKDKVVSFGPEGSAGQAAARKAFAALGVTVKETPLDLDNALDGLATGDVAAVVVLAPQPDRRLAQLKTGSGLHLVSWPDGTAVPDGAAVASISGSAYPALARPGESIRAMGVEAALDANGKGATTPAAKAFLAALSQHSAALSKRGFDLIKADLETRGGRRIASAERR